MSISNISAPRGFGVPRSDAPNADAPSDTTPARIGADAGAFRQSAGHRETLGLAPRLQLANPHEASPGIAISQLGSGGVRGLGHIRALEIDGGSTVEENRFDASKAAHDAFEAMHGGAWGAGTDEDALFAALERSPKELEQMRAYYSDHYGRSLDDDVEAELKGDTTELARGRALLRGDLAEADAIAIRDEPARLDKLHGTSEAHRAEVREAYDRRAQQDGEPALRDTLDDTFDGPKRIEAHALLDGNDNAAAAAAAEQALLNGDGRGVVDALSRDGLDGEAVKEAYAKHFGGDLEEKLSAHEAISGATQVQAMGKLNGNEAAFEAGRVGEALSGGDPEAAYRVIQKSADRKALAQTYEALFDAPISDHVKMLEDGPVKDRGLLLLAGDDIGAAAAKLEAATEGAGTDEKALFEVYEGRPRAEIEMIEDRWRSDYGKDAEHALSDELSGRDAFEVMHARKGRPHSAKEALDRARERVEYERSGISGLVDIFTDKGEMAERSLARAEEFQAELTEHGRPTKAQHARLRELVGYVEQDADSLIHAKDSLAETGGHVASALGATALIGATVLSGGTLTPVTAPLLGALGGSAGSLGWHSAIQGDALTASEAASAAGWGGVGGAGIGWGAAGLMGRALGGHVAKNAGLEAGLGAGLS